MEKIDIEIRNRRDSVVDSVSGECIPVGAPGAYKPCVARLPDGDLLLVFFTSTAAGEGQWSEEINLVRSGDGGRSWTQPENLTIEKGLRGREPYITMLSDGTLLVTVHFLSIDVRNKDDFTKSYVHRSEDRGRTWTSQLIQGEYLRSGMFVWTTRNVLELTDRSLMLGAGSNGQKNNYVWRSYDHGRTWSETYRAEFRGLSPSYDDPVFNEGVWWQAPSGKIYLIQRMDISGAEQFFGEDAKKYLSRGDYCSCLILWETTDGGHTFESPRPIGRIGEMYPSILRLRDERLLYTFTDRSEEKPLGVRAVLGTETGDGFAFDFQHDRFMLDTKTASNVESGGGFGPTVQLDDGTLVTSYSYRTADDRIHAEVLRWGLPER